MSSYVNHIRKRRTYKRFLFLAKKYSEHLGAETLEELLIDIWHTFDSSHIYGSERNFAEESMVQVIRDLIEPEFDVRKLRR